MAAERGRKTSCNDKMAGNTQRASEHLSEISVADENTFLSRRAAEARSAWRIPNAKQEEKVRRQRAAGRARDEGRRDGGNETA